MSKTFVIADLHGRYDLLEKAFNAIYDRREPDATIVTLGDYIDRGPESKLVIDILRAAQNISGGKLICLKGNHAARGLSVADVAAGAASLRAIAAGLNERGMPTARGGWGIS